MTKPIIVPGINLRYEPKGNYCRFHFLEWIDRGIIPLCKICFVASRMLAILTELWLAIEEVSRVAILGIHDIDLLP